MIEQQPQLNEPDPAPPSPTASPPTPTPATKSSTPALPPELVADIIDLAVKLLVKEERDLASQIPITNHFLLSAMLVDRTWHLIAAAALLKNGLVTPASVDLFVAQVKSHQLEPTLKSVRFGLGNAGLDDARDSSGDDARFEALVGSLPGLKRLEIFGEGLKLRRSLSSWHHSPLNQLVLSNAGQIFSHTISHKLESIPPTTLYIYESRPDPQYMSAPVEIERYRAAYGDHLEYPSLSHLAADLHVLHYFATTGTRPSLSSLEALPSLIKSSVGTTREEAERMLLELVDLPVLANLKVPACWRSDAVEGACEAKGIDLHWV
ncbi:hypothetical protein RQP46_002944 [Phenoliferia psychrophenolica]